MKPSPNLVALVLLLTGPCALRAQLEAPPLEGVDYRVFDAEGNASSFAAIASAASRSEVLLLGEEHDDDVGHAVEASLLAAALDALAGRQIVLSLEMFERDVQYVVDEYVAGLISEEHFLASVRPWDEYAERYRPLVEAAKARGVPVVAANAPRRYVNRVTREGPESLVSLSPLARRYLPPLPYPGPSDAYRTQWETLMGEAMSRSASDASTTEAATEPGGDTASGADHAISGNAIYAQALWDASMGHAIAVALVEHLGALVLHMAGSFHVAHGTGIQERIVDYRPGTRVTSVVMTKVDDVGGWAAEEHAGLGDFVILTRKSSEESAPTP